MFQGTGALAFNATFYLQQNPDVFQAIQTGAFQGSALDHFMQFGQFEGRDPNAFFDTEYYLSENPDVLTAIADPANPSVTSAFQHFVTFGFAEGAVRAPSAQFEGFNPDTYLAANPDLQAAFGNLTGEALDNRLFQHFVEFGVGENRPGSGVLVDANPGVPGETFAFTVAADQLTGTSNNDTFTGVVGGSAPTFQAGDQANGGGGVDRLNLLSLGGAAVTGTILSNIEQVYARALDTTELNATLWEGVDQLWSDRSTAAVTYTNVQESATLGLNNTSSALNATFAAGAFETNDTLNLVSNNSSSTVTVTAAGTTFTGLNVAATGENVLTAAAAETATTVTLTGNGSLELVTALKAATTVDASANTGGVDLDFTGNAGNVTVTGGAGDDRFDFDLGLTKTDVVDGGAGFNTVVVNAATAGGFASVGGAAPFNALKNIDRVEFDGSGSVTLQGNTFTNAGITNLLFNNAGGATVLNAGSARTYEFGNTFSGTAAFELKAAATELNVALLGDEGGDTVANGAGLTALNVAYAAGTAATAVTTVNLESSGELTGTETNSITGGIAVREGSTIVISGDADLVLGATRAAAAPTGATAEGFTIDASGFTGDLTLSASTVQEDITLGAGEDIVIFGAGTSGIVSPDGLTPVLIDIDVITGFTAGLEGDTLQATSATAASFVASEGNLDALASSLLEATNLAISGGGTGDAAFAGGGTGWTAFEFGGETYAVFNASDADAAAGFTSGTDVLVQLSGVTLDDLVGDNFTSVA